MPELAALFHSAEDAIEMWEKAEIAAAAVPNHIQNLVTLVKFVVCK